VSGVRHFVGLDLGPTSDYTALAVLERPLLYPDTPRRDRRPAYALRHLRRFPPGTGYPAVAEAVRTLLRTPPMPGAVLGVDQTGVGRAVMELFSNELAGRVWCLFAPVTITGSGAPPGAAVGLAVPKLELVGTLQVLLQTRRLKVADSLPEAPVLVRELEAFRAAPPVLRGEAVESWRERDHDDLVLAVAVAAWLGELAAVTECGG
jgi:Terminase RNaseH-like domain